MGEKMKTIFIYLILLTVIFSFTACQRNDLFQVDNQPPSAPTGLYIVNGDNRVDISWYNNTERDIAGYNVYYSTSYNGKYTLIGSTTDNYYIDYGARNGDTYYYAVTAYDYNGNESDLSYDDVSATPRPEGLNETVFDYRAFPNSGGFSFTTYTDVPYDDKSTDFYFENYNGVFYIDVWNDSDIQDMGATTDIYDISYAPESGWAASKDAVAIPGHTYVIWTWDNHYAKIRVKSITSERMIFDWAFQTVKGNAALKIKAVPAQRNPLDKNLLNRK